MYLQDNGKTLLEACVNNDWEKAEALIISGSYLEACDQVHVVHVNI